MRRRVALVEIQGEASLPGLRRVGTVLVALGVLGVFLPFVGVGVVVATFSAGIILRKIAE